MPIVATRSFSSAGPPAPGGGGGSGRQEEWWESDPRFQTHKTGIPNQAAPGGQPFRDYRMGVYATTMKKDSQGKIQPYGKFWVSPRKDPVTFVTNVLILGITLWTTVNLSKGESYFERRKKVLRDRIRREFDLPEGWDDEIEEDDDFFTKEDAPIIQDLIKEEHRLAEAKKEAAFLASKGAAAAASSAGQSQSPSSTTVDLKQIALQNPVTVLEADTDDNQQLIDMTDDDLEAEFSNSGVDKGRLRAKKVQWIDMIGFPGMGNDEFEQDKAASAV